MLHFIRVVAPQEHMSPGALHDVTNSAEDDVVDTHPHRHQIEVPAMDDEGRVLPWALEPLPLPAPAPLPGSSFVQGEPK